MTRVQTTAVVLMPSLRVTVATLVRSTVRVTMLSFGVPRSSLQIAHGTATCSTIAVPFIVTTTTSKPSFRCVLLGIKNLDSLRGCL